MANSLDNMQVAILVTDGFEESELTEPKRALERAGAKTRVIAPHGGTIYAMRHHDKAGTVKVDEELSGADPSEFDAVMLPGGALNADALRMNKAAQQFVKEMDREGKPIAVICHGPWLLVSAGLVNKRKMTSYYTIQDDLRNAGVKWQYSECVVDGNLVSSRQPSDLPKFNQEMIRVFTEHSRLARKAA